MITLMTIIVSDLPGKGLQKMKIQGLPASFLPKMIPKRPCMSENNIVDRSFLTCYSAIAI